MRIVHWYPNFLGGGGVANLVAALAGAQAGLGHEVTIVAARAARAPLYEPMTTGPGVGLHVYAPSFTARAGRLVLRPPSPEDRRALRSLRADAVHVHGEFNPDNLLAPRIFGAPLVLSPQGAFHPVVFEKSRTVGKRAYTKLARAFLYRHVGAFHATTPREGEHIAALVPNGRVYVVPQGPGPGVRAAARGRGPDGVVRALFAGRLDVYTKGLDILVDAAAAAGIPSLELRLAGKDPGGAGSALAARARERGARLTLLGPLTADELSQELADADLYLHLSRHEGAPLAVSEALTAGLPSVLSREVGTASYEEVSGLPHVRVVAAAAGPAAAAIRELANGLPGMHAAAQATIGDVREFFAWPRQARLHVAEYERLGARSERPELREALA